MIRIRAAALGDRAAIWKLHTASIRQLCAKHYAADQVERWAGFLTPEHYTAVITDPRRQVVVAEMAGKIVGFGQFHPDAAEVEAVYVDPEHAGVGVGSALMRHFEDRARQSSLPSLRLTATLNAVPFYRRQGFLVTGQGEHQHPSGIVLRFVTMAKTLQNAADRGNVT